MSEHGVYAAIEVSIEPIMTNPNKQLTIVKPNLEGGEIVDHDTTHSKHELGKNVNPSIDIHNVNHQQNQEKNTMDSVSLVGENLDPMSNNDLACANLENGRNYPKSGNKSSITIPDYH